MLWFLLTFLFAEMSSAIALIYSDKMSLCEHIVIL